MNKRQTEATWTRPSEESFVFYETRTPQSKVVRDISKRDDVKHLLLLPRRKTYDKPFPISDYRRAEPKSENRRI